MSDWADMQALLIQGETACITGNERARQRAAIAEALWQAYENGVREGENRELRKRLAELEKE